MRRIGTFWLVVFFWINGLQAQTPLTSPSTTETAMTDSWKLAFQYDGTGDWQQDWFLDGQLAQATPTPKGLLLKTGPIDKRDSSHAVLWTRQSFEGNVRIEYDFTRVDSNMDHTSVCILYFHAKGTGKEPYAEDIYVWRQLRQVPSMNLYFQHMSLYHISYACTGGKDFDYIRARRYPTKGNFSKDTKIDPSYDNVDLFEPGETWHLVFEKVGHQMSFTATMGDKRHQWSWDTSSHPPLTSGRVGLRQMLGRESLYANFKVFTQAGK